MTLKGLHPHPHARERCAHNKGRNKTQSSGWPQRHVPEWRPTIGSQKHITPYPPSTLALNPGSHPQRKRVKGARIRAVGRHTTHVHAHALTHAI